jgi:hypothetical protein
MEDDAACDDESPGGPKALPLTETALRQFRSEQPKQKDRPKAVSLKKSGSAQLRGVRRPVVRTRLVLGVWRVH